MRVSRFGLLRLGAVLTVLSTVPCLGQSQFTVITVHANHASQLSVPDLQGKSLKQSRRSLQKTQTELQQLLKEKPIPGENAQLYALSMSKTATNSAQLAQRGCFTMQVFSYPKGFPDKNAAALPKVSDCTPASRFHAQGLVQGERIYEVKKQR